MTILCTIELFCILINLVGSTMDDTILCRDRTNLIVVVSKVSTYTVDEILTNLVIPRKTNLNTLVLYITTIDDRTTCTGCSQDRSLNQPILGILDITIQGQRQTLTEETSIQTNIVLLRGLPLYILVGKTACISTIYPSISTTCGTEVVIGISCSNRCQVLVALDVGITYLTPRETEFQEIQPRSCRLHEILFCQSPTCTD